MLLSIDSSAVTVSVALTDGDKIIKSEFLNNGLTHSETLLPMIKRVLNDVELSSVDGIAITTGPGSFTGVRIGVSTAKGIAFANNIPCYSVSTLEAIAHNFNDGIVCAVMDARRLNFYSAIFEVQNGLANRLTPDKHISINDLRAELLKYENVIIAGDGAKLCYDNINIDNCIIADDEKVFQNAIGVAKAVVNKNSICAKQLVPVYLMQSQAERELKLKK